MTHPINRRDRFLKSVNKGKKRGQGYWQGAIIDPLKDREFLERAKHLRRNTTKLCSCSMCGNQRKILGETMQEKRAKAIETED